MNQLTGKISMVAFLICVATVPLTAQEDMVENRNMLIEQQVIAVRNEVEVTSKKLAEIEAKIQNAIGSLQDNSVSDIAYEDVYRRLQVHKVELTIELKGLAARMNLLKERVEETSDAKDVVSDTKRQLLGQYLRNNLKNSEDLARLHKKGMVSSQEVETANQLVLEAELKLKEFDMKSRQASPAFVEALFETSLAIAERKAKLEAVQELLVRHVKSRSKMESLKQLMESRNTETGRLNNMVSELQKLETAKNALESAANERFWVITTQLEALKDQYGPGHPKVEAVMKQLELAKKYLRHAGEKTKADESSASASGK